jgi:hypothetical protein
LLVPLYQLTPLGDGTLSALLQMTIMRHTVAEGMMQNSDNNREENQRPGHDDDALYDLRTHLTDATLAAGYLRRTDTDPENPKRRRVQEHLNHAHAALREDVERLDSLDTPHR